MSDAAHPGKMHMYNAMGYCWCGQHRDSGLADAICEVIKKAEPKWCDRCGWQPCSCFTAPAEVQQTNEDIL